MDTTPFQAAVLRHMKENRTTIESLADGSGVSSDVIKKLRTRDNYSTAVENGISIAAFYGMSVNEFVSGRSRDEDDAMAAILALLTDDERKILTAQIRGLLSGRDRAAG